MKQQGNGSTSTFSTWQLTVLVVMAGMGGMYFYPETVSRRSAAVLLVTVMLVMASMAMLAYCYRQSGSVSFPNLLEEHLGGVLSRVILAVGAVCFGAEACCVAVRQTQMTGLFLLEKTPPQVVLAVTLVTVCFMIPSGIRQIARTAELLFLAILLPLGFIIAMALYHISRSGFGELMPLFRPVSAGGEWSMTEWRHAVMPLCGISAAGYFAGYYEKKKMTRGLLGGTALLSVCCVLILLCCVGVFSIEGTRHLSFPLTELSRIVSVGNVSLNHRFDILYIMIYTAVSMVAAGVLLYCCGISLCGVFRVKSHSCFVFLLLPVVFAASYLGLSDSRFLEGLAAWGKLFFLGGLVPVLFLVTVYEQRRRKSV